MVVKEIALLVLILLNIVVTIFILYRDDTEAIQKFLQIVVVWLIPFLGGIGLWLFHRSQNFPVRPSKDSFGGGPSDGTGGATGDN